MSFVAVPVNTAPIPTLYGTTTSYSVPSNPLGGVIDNGHVNPASLPVDTTSAPMTLAPGTVTVGSAFDGNGTINVGATLANTATATVAQLKSMNPMWWLLIGIFGLVILKKHH